MDAAIWKQIETHHEMGAMAPVPIEEGIRKGDVLPSQMLLMYKHKPAGLVASARWIVGGHLAKDAGEYATYSPTALGVGHYLLLLAAATQEWRLQSFDVTAAFLQGEELPPERVLYMRLPNELSDGVVSGVRKLFGECYRVDLVRIKKGVFGLEESPRLWHQRARAMMLELGFRKSRLVPCVFSMWAAPDARGRSRMMALVSLHIDEGAVGRRLQGRLRLSALGRRHQVPGSLLEARGRLRRRHRHGRVPARRQVHPHVDGPRGRRPAVA